MCDGIERFWALARRIVACTQGYDGSGKWRERERDRAPERKRAKERRAVSVQHSIGTDWENNELILHNVTHTSNRRMRTASAAAAAADLFNYYYYVLFHYLSHRNLTPKTNGNMSFEIKRCATAASVEYGMYCTLTTDERTKIIKQKRQSSMDRDGQEKLIAKFAPTRELAAANSNKRCSFSFRFYFIFRFVPFDSFSASQRYMKWSKHNENRVCAVCEDCGIELTTRRRRQAELGMKCNIAILFDSCVCVYVWTTIVCVRTTTTRTTTTTNSSWNRRLCCCLLGVVVVFVFISFPWHCMHVVCTFARSSERMNETFARFSKDNHITSHHHLSTYRKRHTETDTRRGTVRTRERESNRVSVKISMKNSQ